MFTCVGYRDRNVRKKEIVEKGMKKCKIVERERFERKRKYERLERGREKDIKK